MKPEPSRITAQNIPPTEVEGVHADETKATKHLEVDASFDGNVRKKKKPALRKDPICKY